MNALEMNIKRNPVSMVDLVMMNLRHIHAIAQMVGKGIDVKRVSIIHRKLNVVILESFSNEL